MGQSSIHYIQSRSLESSPLFAVLRQISRRRLLEGCLVLRHERPQLLGWSSAVAEPCDCIVLPLRQFIGERLLMYIQSQRGPGCDSFSTPTSSQRFTCS